MRLTPQRLPISPKCRTKASQSGGRFMALLSFQTFLKIEKSCQVAMCAVVAGLSGQCYFYKEF
ncbi:hypothetical protein BOS5A_180031 [Bosea sp. EC-HK365B]|nr:hypothetical protein BOSE21B_80131 [Bosea sp. 21B]CAD5299862.1 hypothetical protein BOSE7B_60681 [Bosea sp. 7B]VVT57055.1 hypothetical protein BOS5A_180031 [Bosea sp. EC-HK365B]VXB47856.1 hypothetical protein BOSE127_120143 [Bosea sp. 127]